MNHITNTAVYVRLHDPLGGPDVIKHHMAWDVQRFMASQHEQYAGPKVKTEDRRIVTIATERDYREYKGYKGAV